MMPTKDIIMLGKHTKCDMSAGQATIDTDKLTKQMEIYFYSLMNKMQAKASEVRFDNNDPKDKKEVLLGMVSTGADSIISMADNIAEVSELLYTLYNLNDRTVTLTKPTG
jgi:hypothetical protein